MRRVSPRSPAPCAASSRGAAFVAHNARFDYSFLRSEFSKAGLSFSAPVLCTVKLSRRLFPEFARHNLDAVMERNGLTCSARHRALGDAKVIHDFWRKLRREVPQPQLAQAVHTVLGAHQLPDHLPPGLADELPEGPGVYRFFGEDDVLLYVGRSHSLRTRVCRHSPAAMRIRRITGWAAGCGGSTGWRPPGNWGAMLRNAEWIRTQRPLFNLRANPKVRPHTLRAVTVSTALGPAQGVEPVAIDAVDLADLMQCFGVFHSAKDAARRSATLPGHSGCAARPWDWRTARARASPTTWGKCRGACMGKEPLLLHGARLKVALASLKFKTWPFPGRIALRERDPRGGAAEFMRRTDLHVLDHWAHIGTARSEEELAALRTQDCQRCLRRRCVQDAGPLLCEALPAGLDRFARSDDLYVSDNVRYWIATAPVGAASVLAEELARFGAHDIRERSHDVKFQGTLEAGYRTCLWSRTATACC